MIGEERKLTKVIDISIYLIIIFIFLTNFFKNNFLLDIPPKINNNLEFYGRINTDYGGSLLLTFIPQNILIFTIMFFSIYSMYEFSGNMIKRRMTKFYAGLLYLINPYAYIRITTGQIFLLFSFATLPLLLKFYIDFLEKQQKKYMIIKFIFVLTIVSFSIHMLILSLIIMAIIFLLWFNKYREIRIIKLFVMSGILFIILNSYWIIPILTARNTIVDNITDKDYEVFAPKGSLFEIAAMYGFWREEYIYTKDFIPGWQILYLIILSLTIIGFLTYYKDEKIGYMVKAIGVIGIIGFILASGIKGPFGDQIYWLFDNTILKGFRDSHKFVSMMVLAYAGLGGLGVNSIQKYYENMKEDIMK